MRRVFRTRRIAVCAGLILALVLFVLAVRASVLRVPGMGGERSSIAQSGATAQPQSAGEQKGGGNLANYRTMVINHETGHRLDHRDNETVCQQAGEPAPLMQQQSISLRGCTINEWPLDSELWARW